MNSYPSARVSPVSVSNSTVACWILRPSSISLICHWISYSIWFGERTFDGLLFPLLALVATDLARRGVLNYQVVVVLRIAVSVFLALAVIRLIARVMRAVFPGSALVRLVERTVSWIAWVGAVLWIVGLLPPVLAELDQITLSFGNNRVSIRTIFEGALSAGLVLVIALWISTTIEKRILREAVTDLSMRKVASNAVRAFLLLIGLLVALSAVGVDLTALSVLGGAVGVGLGFGLQKLAANYVSGFVILLEHVVPPYGIIGTEVSSYLGFLIPKISHAFIPSHHSISGYTCNA